MTEEEVREHFEEDLRRIANERDWTEEEARECIDEVLATLPENSED